MMIVCAILYAYYLGGIGNSTHPLDRSRVDDPMVMMGGEVHIGKSGQYKLVIGIGGPVVDSVWCNDHRLQL